MKTVICDATHFDNETARILDKFGFHCEMINAHGEWSAHNEVTLADNEISQLESNLEGVGLNIKIDDDFAFIKDCDFLSFIKED